MQDTGSELLSKAQGMLLAESSVVQEVLKVTKKAKEVAHVSLDHLARICLVWSHQRAVLTKC